MRTNTHYRMSSCFENVFSHPFNFVGTLNASGKIHWVDSHERQAVNVFDHDVMFIPFEAHGQKLMFVLIGARNINDYLKVWFDDACPCIHHVVPYHSTMRVLDYTNGTATNKV